MATKRFARALLLALALTAGMVRPARATDFGGGSIAIPDSVAAPAAGDPYPSTIAVAGLQRVVGKVTVRLRLTHPLPDEIDAVLVGPGGQSVMLMSDVGSAPASAVSLTFDDDAPTVVPDSFVTGTYRPTNVDDGVPDAFPLPAPQDAPGAALSIFKGTDPNGTWRLYAVDDTAFDGGQISSWRLSITDGPGSPVQWASSAYAVQESAGSVAVTLTRTGGLLPGSVYYSTRDGGAGAVAHAGSDYSARTGTLTFAAGQSSGTVSIPIADDSTDENDKSFRVHVDSTAGDAAATDARFTTVTITDDDPPPTLSIADITVPEHGTAGPSAFTLTLSAPSELSVSGQITFAPGTARPSRDYNTGSPTISLHAGATTMSVSIHAVDDGYDEPDETLTATLTNLVNATVGRGRATATIIDDDNPAPPELSGARSQAVLKQHGLRIGVTTNFDGTASARARITLRGSARAYRLESAKTPIIAGHRLTLKLPLTSAARRALRSALAHGQRPAAHVSVTTAGPSGQTGARRTIKLRN